jgi:hypothetical protein
VPDYGRIVFTVGDIRGVFQALKEQKKEAFRLQSCLGSGLPVGSVLHCSIRGASHNLDLTICQV